MERDEVLSIIGILACSQGYYGRLLDSINELNEEELDEFFGLFSNCEDMIDVIMVIEQ